MAIDVVPEIPTIKVIDQEIKVLSVLEGTGHIDNELMIEFAEYILLVHDGVNTFLGDDFGLIHNLESIGFSVFFFNNLPNSSKSPLPNDLLQLEHPFVILIAHNIHY